MTNNPTVEDILRRVLESGRHVISYERTSRRITTKGADQTESQSTDIRVGEDLYESSEPADWMWREELTYRGKRYARVSEDSPWQTPEELGWSTVAEGTLTAEGLHEWDDSLLSREYALDLGGFLSARRLPDDIGSGGRLVRLSVTHALPLDMPTFDDMMKKMLPGRAQVQGPEGKLDQFREQFSMLPDAIKLKEDLLIDARDFRLHAVEVEGTVYRAGEVVESFVETRSYSKFNEAELPGPLPES